MTGLPSRITSVTIATRLSVILLKSIYALAIADAIGTVRSLKSTMRIELWGQTGLIVSAGKDPDQPGESTVQSGHSASAGEVTSSRYHGTVMTVRPAPP